MQRVWERKGEPMSKRVIHKRHTAWVAVCGLLIVVLTLGCSAPNNVDQTAVIAAFSVTPSTLEEGSTAIVEILITDSQGRPREGVTVTLAVEPANYGTLASATITTGADGIAATTYTASEAGLVTFEISADNAETQWASITVESASSAAGSITISVTPGVMAAGSASQAAVGVNIYDANGWSVYDSTLVRFVAGEKFNDVDQNGFWTAGVDELIYDVDEDGEWDAVGEIDPEVWSVSGNATAYYTAGNNSTTVYIKATAFLAAGIAQSDASLALSAGTGCLLLELESPRLHADGAEQTQITIYACDSDGGPAPDNTEVRLVAGERFLDVNKDGEYSICCDELQADNNGNSNWDANGVIDEVVYTVGGVATATYTAGTNTGEVYILGSIGTGDGLIQSDAVLTLLPADSVASINLAPDAPRTQVRGTGGIEWTRIVATAYDAFGNRAAQDLPIDFSISQGPGGGENLNGDPEGPVTILTDENGQATVTFNAGTLSGTAQIRAIAGNVVSAATQVVITSGPPAYVTVGAGDCNVPSWEEVNYRNDIVAVVNDEWGNEVADSTAVYFWTEQGTIEGFDGTHIAFTERGVAKSVWKSSKPKDDGYVYYWAETDGGTVADTSVFLESGLPGTTTIVEYPTELLADGKDKGDVVVTVYDINNVFMDTDYPIKLKSTYGNISSGALGDGCHSSYFDTELRSQTFDQDYSYTVPDDGIIGNSLLEAIAGGYFGAYDSKIVVFKSSSAYYDNCNIDVETTIPHGISVPVKVIIKDRYNNPLGGHKITIASQNGIVADSVQYTDAWGVASGFTYTATTNFGIALDFLTARDDDPGYGGIIITQKISVKEEE